ncbi:metallophosphoesterase [Geobacter sp.]|uniref:metallophosphoesterase n=1 Tax=Geobacter sp. TaxID=46610 RepID=UPI00260C6046|nr:metallophosphoesterase [Geobacter sp.]
MRNAIDRRTFLKQAGALTAAASLPFGLVNVAWGKKPTEKFTFAYISDAHITQIRGTEFVANFDKGLQRAALELNFLDPKPDFVVFGGDLAQLGKREEFEHGRELMKDVTIPIKWVIGEHDYYLDLGAYWQEHMAPLHYSFDHKGVHFVALNSILTHDEWTFRRWPTAQERMHQMARLDNPDGSPFMVKAEQREWLKKDLAKVPKDTPIVILSHSPLYKIFRPWNFWTDDADEVQAILKPYQNVMVFHGHVHQVLYNQIGTITFNAFMATAWPWPYPVTYSQLPNKVPEITVFMNRADPFKERDGTGWGNITMDGGEIHHYELWENTPRTVEKMPGMKYPADTKFQDPKSRIPAQTQY